MNNFFLLFFLSKVHIQSQESKFYRIWDATKFCPRNELGDYICNVDISNYNSRYKFSEDGTVTIYEGKLNNYKVSERKFMVNNDKLILKVGKYETRSSFIFEFAANENVLFLTIPTDKNYGRIYLKKRI